MGRIELDKQVPHAGLQPLHQLSPDVEFPGVGGLLDLQNKLLFTVGVLHVSMGNFIDLGKSPFSKKTINVD